MNISFNSSTTTSPYKSPKISRQHHINADDADTASPIQFESYDGNESHMNATSYDELFDNRPLISILTSSPGKHKLNVTSHVSSENRSNFSLDKLKTSISANKGHNLSSTSKLFVDYHCGTSLSNNLPLSRKSSFNSVRFGPYISNQSIYNYNSSLENHGLNSGYNSINGDLTGDAHDFAANLSASKTPRLMMPISNLPSIGLLFFC